MLRWLATLVIAALFVLNLWMPSTPLARRGNERTVRMHVPALAGRVGHPLPALSFEDLDGQVVTTADLLGHPLLLVFERSVDW
jgi:cytochrome oxidase Cu insertion factor (SCO1/SenC/PrrC family)